MEVQKKLDGIESGIANSEDVRGFFSHALMLGPALPRNNMCHCLLAGHAGGQEDAQGLLWLPRTPQAEDGRYDRGGAKSCEEGVCYCSSNCSACCVPNQPSPKILPHSQIFKDRKKDYETAANALKQATVEQEKAKLFSSAGDGENKDEEEDVRDHNSCLSSLHVL